MSERKRYTAQEMRDFANDINQYGLAGACMGRSGNRDGNTIAAMLRQSADNEDELTKLKSRLEAVVKECDKQIPACRGEDCKCNPTDSGYCDENCHDEIIVHTAVTAILRVARGDAGKGENEGK